MVTKGDMSAVAFLYSATAGRMATINSWACLISYFIGFELVEKYFTLLTIIAAIWLVIIVQIFYKTFHSFGKNLPIGGNSEGDLFFYGGVLLLCHMFSWHWFQTSLLSGFLMTCILFAVLHAAYSIFGCVTAWLSGIILFIALILILPIWWTKNEVMFASIYTGYMILSLISVSSNFDRLGNSLYFKKNSKDNIERIGTTFYFFEAFFLLLSNIINQSFISDLIQKNGEIIQAYEFNNHSEAVEEKPDTKTNT